MNTTQQLCVVFDLDDTLYKERDFVRSGYTAVAEYIAGRFGVEADGLIQLMNESDNAFDALLSHNELKNDITISDILTIYRSHIPDLTLPKESREVLDSLIKMNIGIAIITDGHHLTQWNKIKSLGLDRIVDPGLIIVSEDIGADKTTVVPFKTVMDLYPVSQYIYIGDNPTKDFRFAKELGWMTVMLKDKEGVNVHPQNLDNIADIYKPDLIIDSISQLTDIILPCLQH